MADCSRIATGSHVTLHYRIAVIVGDAEREVISTFESRPATLTIGAHELAAPLESRLIGLAEGARERFDLASGEGFGMRNPELVQVLSRAVFDANSGRAEDYAPGDVVEFASPEGVRFSGVLKEHGGERVVVDFNHPLAGLPVRFDVQIVGVL
jgi:FKBP-type peptidyl-prolyl cis-trans isomerase SlpA